MVVYGYYIIGVGIFALIVSAVLIAFRLGYHKSTLLLGACLIGLGASLVYIGPWLAWIFGAVVAVIIAALVFVVVKNARNWLIKAEIYTGLELIDETPSSSAHVTVKKGGANVPR